MGLDIYAGTLTRYYGRTWKTAAQQHAESIGIGYQVFRANDDSSRPLPDIADIQAHVQQWSESVSAALSGGDFVCLPWEENNDKEYYTNKPDWLAFEALQLFGACLHYGLPFPETVKKRQDLTKEPALERAIADPEFNWSLYSSAEWWLPYDGQFVFRGAVPNGTEVVFGTTALLRAELDAINAGSWKADRETILGWEHSEGYPPDGYFEDGKYIPTVEHTEYDAESLAKFAFSVLYRAVEFSAENRVPIILDY